MLKTMLQYLIILLDEASVSFCHYNVPAVSQKYKGLISLDTLRAGIFFAMKENLNIQFVYPPKEIPKEYADVIESIDHTKIKPESHADDANILVLTEWKTQVTECAKNATCIIQASRQELKEHLESVKVLLSKVTRLNIMLTDIDSFSDEDIDDYQSILNNLSDALFEQYMSGRMVHLNLLTDRMLLSEMNNCGAGDTCLTLAPNGKFYPCPAHYYDNPKQYVGTLKDGLNIKNQYLFRLDHAPICRHCDAYQCKRCVWMNSKLTLDVNTPSHQQCVVAHLERNASRNLITKMKEQGVLISDTHEIGEIDYLDPFNNYKQWK